MIKAALDRRLPEACGGTSVLNRVREVRRAGNDAELKFLVLAITKQLPTDDKMILVMNALKRFSVVPCARRVVNQPNTCFNVRGPLPT